MSPNSVACLICGTTCVLVIDLPGLPLTDSYGVFGQKPAKAPPSGTDQQLFSCPECGHGQLGTIVPPEALYTSEYSFRTSTSHTANAGTDFFVSFLDQIAPGRQFTCALDVGCNDLHLLGRLKDRVRFRVGIDPIWAGREHENPDSSITVSGEMFESVDLETLLPARLDLVMARHTMEHIHQPVKTIRRLLDHATDDAVVVIEVPGFDTLIRRQRYDQVFHQHIHYYSRSSLERLLQEVGGEMIGWSENYHNWGATLVAFRKAGSRSAPSIVAAPTVERIAEGYHRFQREAEDFTTFTKSLGGPIYGYGAAQMLPVLGYHLKTDFSFLEAILDDDPAKDGIGYWNLPVVIKSPGQIDLSNTTVVITAVDNTAPIMRRLLQHRPKHVVTPFRLI